MRKEGGKGGLADAPFTGEHEDLVSDLRKALGDDGDIWIGAFGSGGADGLVGTAGAGIALTGLFRLGTWTVFFYGLETSYRGIFQLTYLVQERPVLAPSSQALPGTLPWAPLGMVPYS